MAQRGTQAPLGGDHHQRIPGPAEARYVEAVALLTTIGPGAAAAMQMHRYESALLDNTNDNHDDPGDNVKDSNSINDMKFWRDFKDNGQINLDVLSLETAATQVVTDMAHLRKMAARHDSDQDDRRNSDMAEAALNEFIKLGNGSGDDEASRVKQAILKLSFEANLEPGVKALRGALAVLDNNKDYPEAIIIPPPAYTGKKQYENAVKILVDGFGEGTANAFRAIRYAREPIDRSLDARGNDLFPEDTKSIQDKRVMLDAAAPGSPIKNSFLVASFGGRVLLGVVNANDTGRPGFPQRRANMVKAVKAFVAAGGGNPDAAEKSFNMCGTYSDDRDPRAEPNRAALIAQIWQAADNITDNLIKEEHPEPKRPLQSHH